MTLAFGGESANLNSEPIIASVLRGLLSGFLAQKLNYVNAPFLARERGISGDRNPLARDHRLRQYADDHRQHPRGKHEVAAR